MTWFRDPQGKFGGQIGGLELELILRRRESGRGQTKLLVVESERKGSDFLIFRESN